MSGRKPKLAFIRIILIALIGIALTYSLLETLCRNDTIPPYRTERWIDLKSGRMEIRHFPMFAAEHRHQPNDQWNNNLARDYLIYVGPYPAKTDWVMLSWSEGYGRSKKSKDTEYDGLRFGQRGVSNFLRRPFNHQEHPSQTFTDKAKGEYIIRYLEVAQKSRGGELNRNFSLAHHGIVYLIDHPVTIEDLVDVDTFIANPDPGLYYDTEKFAKLYELNSE